MGGSTPMRRSWISAAGVWLPYWLTNHRSGRGTDVRSVSGKVVGSTWRISAMHASSTFPSRPVLAPMYRMVDSRAKSLTPTWRSRMAPSGSPSTRKLPAHGGRSMAGVSGGEVWLMV